MKAAVAAGARRLGRWRDHELAQPQHGDRVAAWLGLALGISFTVCFLTGLLSHLIQQPPAWFDWPARPAGLYRVTQGLHVVTGLAAVPLLLAKLWSVFPRLFRWPVFDDIAHAVERVSLLPLVGGALFLLVTGVANIDLWYPWPFFFPAGHYWVAWITIGALIVHIGAKASVTRGALRPERGEAAEEPAADRSGRRRFLAVVGAGSAALTAVTIGQTVSPLRELALFAPRRPDRGPQGFPVNKTAKEAGVVETAASDTYRLVVRSPAGVTELTRADLARLPQRSATLPIACVEGWSASVRWTGVPLREVLESVGAPADRDVRVESLQERGLYRASVVSSTVAADPDTLLALLVDGEQLSLDHGFPVRLIAPNRPGVMQTKWVASVEVR